MVKKDYRVEIAGMGYPINTPSQKARAREMMRVSRIRVVSVYARTPPSSFYSLTGRKFHAERPAGRRTVAASRSNGVRSPSYPYLVVERMTGRVHAGAETRNDAEDMRHDLPTPAADLQTLTREGVRRKFGRISWASVATMRNPQRPSRANGATFAKVTGDRARGSTVRGARHNYRTVEVLVYQSPNSMATARTYEIVTDASYNMGDGAYTTDVWKLPEPAAVQRAIFTAVRNLRGGGRNRRAPVQAE